MGLFSRIGSAVRQAASRASAPFRRAKPQAPAARPQAPAPQAPAPTPQAPRPQGPGPKSQGQLDAEAEEAARRKRIDDRRREMEEEAAARGREKDGQNPDLDNSQLGTASQGERGTVADSIDSLYPEEEGSNAWAAAVRYLDTEDGIDFRAKSYTIRSGKMKGQTAHRSAIRKYDAIQNASVWWKKMDATGVTFNWRERRTSGGRSRIVEVTGLASAAYLAEDRPRYYEGAPSFGEIWDQLAHLVDADGEVLPYRGIW